MASERPPLPRLARAASCCARVRHSTVLWAYCCVGCRRCGLLLWCGICELCDMWHLALGGPRFAAAWAGSGSSVVRSAVARWRRAFSSARSPRATRLQPGCGAFSSAFLCSLSPLSSKTIFFLTLHGLAAGRAQALSSSWGHGDSLWALRGGPSGQLGAWAQRSHVLTAYSLFVFVTQTTQSNPTALLASSSRYTPMSLIIYNYMHSLRASPSQ